MLNKILEYQDREYVNSITKELSLMCNDGGELGFRCAGSSGEWHTSDRIVEEMKAIGLKNVSVEKFPVFAWEPISGSIEIDGKGFTAVPYAGTTGTPDEGITAEVVNVGKGTLEEYEGKDVKGKIVFCTFDMLEDFWVSLPAYQAMQKEAAAFVCTYVGDAYSHHEGAVGCFDSQMVAGFPTCNISRKDGDMLRDMLEKGNVTATLKLIVKTDENGKSSNVIGYVPGKDPSKMIVLAGHMDGFFNTYQDDVLAIGIHLDIARSIIKAGYEPEHTIAVVAHGSEEYGIGGSRYDWCTGSWFNTKKLHPEWFGKAVAFLNIDAVRPDTPVYNIACTQEWRSFFKDFMKDMDQPPAEVWPEGSAITPPKGAWADGLNFSVLGVPELIIGGGPSEWSALNYHTQFDNCSLYEDEKELIQFVTKSYTSIIFEMDKLALPPLDFSHTPGDLIATLEGIPEKEFDAEVEELKKAAESLKSTAEAFYADVCKVNAGTGHDNAALEQKRVAMLDCYRDIHKDLIKLAVDDCEIFHHEEVGNSIKCIDKGLASLEAGNAQQAAKDMWAVDLFKYSYQFDDATYAFIMNEQDFRRDDIYWGTGKIHEYLNTSNLAKNLLNKDIQAAIAELKKLRSEECRIMKEILLSETETVKKVDAKVKSINLKELY